MSLLILKYIMAKAQWEFSNILELPIMDWIGESQSRQDRNWSSWSFPGKGLVCFYPKDLFKLFHPEKKKNLQNGQTYIYFANATARKCYLQASCRLVRKIALFL